MPRRRSFALPAVALALALATASAARSETLLQGKATGPRSLPHGVAHGRALALGRGALADLRGRSSAVLGGFPLGDDDTVELTLTRIEPFAPTARVEVVDGSGVREMPLPDAVYFTGAVHGDPASRALVVAGRDEVHGFVVARGTVYPFGPDGAGGHRSYALRDADPALYPPPGDFCANDLQRDVVDSPAVSAPARAEAGLVPPPVPTAGTTTMLEAEVAVETDHELWNKFGSDQDTLDYLASLAAAATSIYERDVAVHLRFSYIRLWATDADPWSATSTSGQLGEVQSYWTNSANRMDTVAGPHDLVHFVSGKGVQGGIAYVGSVCDPRYQFGVSQVFGNFDLSSPSQIWDVLVTTHEMGHNLGSPHTHCYSPAVDKCYNHETGCYSGPVVASRGTIMSYCHLLSGGLSNIDLVFGDVVSGRIRSTVASASCLAPVAVGVCGDGALDPGEECDDGNITAGDGCSPGCRIEACGNGVLDPGETCDDGNTASGDGCSAGCQREPRCGDGVVDAGEKCDDGNTVSGDGCSDSCKREPCKVLRTGQTLWGAARMTVQRGAPGRDRLALRGGFAIPMAVTTLTPGTTGVGLVLEDAAGETKLEITLPPGPRWLSRRGKWIYKDAAGTVAGIRKLEIDDRSQGGVPEVTINMSGHGTSYPITAADLPATVTIVLGDDTSGLAGACGRYEFGGAGCASTRRGTRLVCR